MQEKTFQLTHQSIGRERKLGRDEAGKPLTEHIPSRASEMMLDLCGNEGWHPLQNARVATAKCADGYARKLRRELIASGCLPVRDCPHTIKYEDDVNGPLVKPPDGKPIVCRGATKIPGDPGDMAVRSKGAKQIFSASEQMYQPCEHYFTVRKLRRDLNHEEAELRRAEARSMDQNAIQEMAAGLKAMAGVVAANAPEPSKRMTKGKAKA